MTPPDSRSQTMRSDEDFSATRTMPFRNPTVDSPICEKPQDPLADGELCQQLQYVVHNQATGVAPYRPYQQAITSQYHNQQYQNSTDPTRAMASPPPPQHGYSSRSVSVDESEYYALHRQASALTGHKYGKTIIKGMAIVHQGNIYDGPQPPSGMKQHEYGDTEMEGIETMTPRVSKGDASGQALYDSGLWHDRLPQERRHTGDHYPRHSGRRRESSGRRRGLRGSLRSIDDDGMCCKARYKVWCKFTSYMKSSQ